MNEFLNSAPVTIILMIFGFLGGLITAEREGFFNTICFFLALIFIYAYAYNTMGAEYCGFLAFFVFIIPISIKFIYNIVQYNREG